MAGSHQDVNDPVPTAYYRDSKVAQGRAKPCLLCTTARRRSTQRTKIHRQAAQAGRHPSNTHSGQSQQPFPALERTAEVAFFSTLFAKNLSKQLCESRRRKNDTDGSSERLKASGKSVPVVQSVECRCAETRERERASDRRPPTRTNQGRGASLFRLHGDININTAYITLKPTRVALPHAFHK